MHEATECYVAYLLGQALSPVHLQVRSDSFRHRWRLTYINHAAVELLHELAEYLHRRYPSVYTVTRHSVEKSTYGWYGEGDIKTITVGPLNRTFNLDEGEPLKIATML